MQSASSYNIIANLPYTDATICIFYVVTNDACATITSTDATAYSNARFGQNANIIIALDDVACTTAQSRLIDCTYDSNTADCSHSDDAGVACAAREFFEC